MDSITIQVGPHHGQQSNLIKCEQQVFNVGRGFNNDLVLQDPYVAANQFRLRKNHSGWFVDILDDTNPVFINGKPVKQSQTEIHSGDWLSIGRTVLRVIKEDQEVEPVRKMIFSNWYHIGRWEMFISISLLVLTTFFFMMLMEYLQQYSEIKWQNLIASPLILLAFLTLWAMVWAIVGRILRHQNQFFIQFLITTVIFLAGSLVEIFFSPVAYLFNSQTLGFVIEWGMSFLVLTILLYFNYSIATNLNHPLRTSAVVSTLILIVIFGLYELEKDSFQGYPDYMQDLYPPAFNLKKEKSINDYINSYDQLFEKIKTE